MRRCPNLEQLGIAVEDGECDCLALLLPFLSKLKAIRFLIDPACDPDILKTSDDELMAAIGQELAKAEYTGLAIVGVGDRLYGVGFVESVGEVSIKGRFGGQVGRRWKG